MKKILKSIALILVFHSWSTLSFSCAWDLAYRTNSCRKPQFCLMSTLHNEPEDMDDEDSASKEDSTSFNRDILEKLWNTKTMGAVPTNSIEGAEEVVKAIRNALFQGKRAQIVDIKAPAFDPSQRVYDKEQFYNFIGSLLSGLAVVGRRRVIVRDSKLQQELYTQLCKVNEWDLEEVYFSSFFGPDGKRSGMGELEALAKQASNLIEEKDSFVVVVLPTTMGEMKGLRLVIELAAGRPILIINPRMKTEPVEMKQFEHVYTIIPLVIYEPESRNKPPKHIVVKREFPDTWKLFIQYDEVKGFEYITSFTQQPSEDAIVSLYLQMRPI